MFRKIILVTGFIALFNPAAYGGEPFPVSLDFQAKVKEKFQNTPIASVRTTPVPGLYEVISGRNILYIDQNLRYALFGGMIDTQTGINLTDARMQEINKIDVSRLPLNHAITFGKGKKHLYIFSDPDCPFCQKLHPELARLKDVTIHLFLYPVKELHPNAFYHSVAVWCAKDRKAALDAIFSGKQLKDKACENPIAANVELGRDLQITGTPTLIFEDGSMAVGYQQPEILQARLEGKKPEPVAGTTGGVAVKETK